MKFANNYRLLNILDYLTTIFLLSLPGHYEKNAIFAPAFALHPLCALVLVLLGAEILIKLYQLAEVRKFKTGYLKCMRYFAYFTKTFCVLNNLYLVGVYYV